MAQRIVPETPSTSGARSAFAPLRANRRQHVLLPLRTTASTGGDNLSATAM
jgi:hypothetical protein